MRSNRGISLIALIVTIIVMIILAAIIIKIGASGIDTTMEARIKNEIRELETAVIKRFSNYTIEKGAYPLLGNEIELTDAINDICTNLGYTEEKIRPILEKDKEYLRKLDASHVKNLGIKNVTGNKYIVDYLDARVYGPIS